MLPKERVRGAFEKRRTDKVPIYQSGFSSRVASAILGREAYVGGGIQQFREARALWDGEDAHAEFLERSLRDALDISLALELDIVRPFYWRLRTRPTRKIDERTYLWGDPQGDHVVRRFDSETELFSEVEERPGPPSDMEGLERHVLLREKELTGYRPLAKEQTEVTGAMERVGSTHAVFGYGAGCNIPHSPAIWLEAVALRSDLVERILDVQVEQARRLTPVVAGLGAPYICGGGDFASNAGPFFSPAVFERVVAPRLREVSKVCRGCGGYYLFASDGNLWPVAEELFGRCGVDGYYEIDDWAGMDLAKLRAAFPQVTLLGGVNSRTLHLGPEGAIRGEVRRAMEAAHRYGGIIVGCSNQIVCDTPARHVEAMMEEMHRLR
ncbi:MAG: uroporphyrinogen decarboxylase family protein [Planctomycetota bacterium]